MAEYIINTDAIPWEGFDKTKAVTFFGEPAQELIRCKDCERWNRNDGTFRDIDGKEWHNCKTLCFRTMAYFYCADAERKANDRTE